MRAINLFAGTGTLTSAFSDQGAEIVWAQEEEETAAEVYQYNFPQVPFFKGALENALEQIPEHDLLLASIRYAVWLFRAAGDEKYAGKERDYREQEEKNLWLLRKVLNTHHPAAVCILLPVQAGKAGATERKIPEMLSEEGYIWKWAVLSGTRHGRVPFTGKGCYLVGFREEEWGSKFAFPEAGEMYMPVKELLHWYEEKEKRYYGVPRWCEEAFQKQEAEPGKIYCVMPWHGKGNMGKAPKGLDCCPALTVNSWYRTFVRDEWGIRKITPEEYLRMQGDVRTKFPPGMSDRKIWEAMRYAGIYSVEEKIAAKIHRILEGTSLQEEIAGYLLREFDQERFLYRKRTGMVCMPPGTGCLKTMKYLVQGILKRTWGKWKVVLLETHRELCMQMGQVLQSGSCTARISASSDEIHEFLGDKTEVLIVTYAAWAEFIRCCGSEGVHVNFVLLGAEAERGWRYLAGTEKYFPQAVYAGIAAVPDLRASEVFGPIRYQYTLQQACKDRLMLPVSIDHLILENGSEESSLLEEKIWKDIISCGRKTLLIAETISQAESLWETFNHYCENEKEDRAVYLYVSNQTPEHREQHLRGFRASFGSVLITVGMWKNLQISDVDQIYVLSKVGELDMMGILNLASRKYSGKEKGRVVILNREVLEKAQAQTDVGEDSKELADFCEHLWKGEYAQAESAFGRIRQFSGKLAEQMKNELELLQGRIPVAKMGQTDKKQSRLMIRLWLLLSRLTGCWEASQNWKAESTKESSEENGADREKQGKEEILQTAPVVEPLGFNHSTEKGAVLENALLKLLRCLFIWDQEDNPDLAEKTEAVMHFLQKRPGGDQNGRDLDLVYLDETGQKRRCCFECKYVQSKKLTEEVILSKLLQAQRSAGGEIEHWILVAPKGRLDKHAAELLEDAERMPGKYYPIKDVQVWNEESGVFELLGLEPELYEIFYGRQSAGRQEPRMWSLEKRSEVLRKWKQKLMPVSMLPAGLRYYPLQPEKILFELQNDVSVRARYESLFQYRVQMSFYEENQRTPQDNLEENMAEWLFSGSCQARLLLGEYAAGKTFFLYCLCRKLLKEFVKNPQKNYLPICISLKNLRDTDSPQDLIERRMKELGCIGSDFYSLKEKFHVLVCLDGFDEISSVIDDKTIGRNIRLLTNCCEYLTGTKILITSRPQCFGKSDIKRWLSDRLEGLEVLHLAPVGPEEGEQFVLFGAEEEERIERWEQLSGNKKIRALMEKPFFLDMIRQLLESGEKIGENTVSIYESYIRKCLQRKFDSSFDREDVALPDTKETVGRIYGALCSMAYSLQELGEETVRISDFEAYMKEPASMVLWREESEKEDIRQDADNRFSMRTLLKHAGDGMAAFAHRSIREYFVAVHLWNLLKEGSSGFREELEGKYFSHEILGFLAELMQDEPTQRDKSLQKLIDLVDQDEAETNLAAKIMQILYFAEKGRKIPKAHWSEKNLADISIPGADLSDQNFRGTKFTNANLNNVCLDGCDCSCCDMTGARLGESGKILSLRYENRELMCLYDDGCLRRWDILSLEENSCISDIPVMEQAILADQGMLCMQNETKIRMIRIQDHSIHIVQEYGKRGSRKVLSISDGLLLLKEDDSTGTKLLLIRAEDGSILREWRTGKNGCGRVGAGKIAVVYDGRGTMELFSPNASKRCGTFETEKRGELTALDVHLQDGVVYILSGYSDGTVWVYQYENGKIRSEAESKLYGLTHLAFCGNEIAALADSEGGIHQALIDYNKGQIRMDFKEVMKLRIHCKRIKTDGLIPESIRIRLRDHS